MPNAEESFGARALRKLAALITARPRLFILPQLVLFALCVLYTAYNLEFSSDRNDLVGSGKTYHQQFLKFNEEFGGQDDLVTVVESDLPEKNRQFVERLGARLEAETDLFHDVFYKGDLRMLGSKALLFLQDSELAELQRTLEAFQPFIARFSQSTNLDSLFRQVNGQFRAAGQSAAPPTDSEAMIEALPALIRIVEQATGAMVRPGTPPAPGMAALFNAGPEAESGQYITFGGGRLYLVTAKALRPELDGDAVGRMRELVALTQAEVPGVNVGVTGEPVLELDEMRQSQKDSAIATAIALSLVAFIFIYAYRETGRPLKATLCLIIGLGYTMAYTTLAVGRLNILTVTFLPILVGLAIDFGVHLITRYEEEMRHDHDEGESLATAMANTGKGIFTGGFTTAGAFFAMGWTDFQGIREMGIITGGGMLICLIPMMTMLPALLLRGRQNVLDHQIARRQRHRRARIENLWLQRPKRLIAATVVLTVLAASQAPKVYFDYNLLNMQSHGLPAVVFEEKLIYSGSKSVLYAAVVADSVEEARRLQERIEQLPTVADVESMSQFMTEDRGQAMESIREIKQIAQATDFAPLDLSPVAPSELSQTLGYTQSYLNLAVEEVRRQEADDALIENLDRLRTALAELRERLRSDEEEGLLRLTRYQQALFTDIAQTFAALESQQAEGPLREEDLPEQLKDRFIGRTGKHLLQVYPKGNVWERNVQEAFVRDLRTVAPDVTGTPVQLYEYTTLLKESYEEAAWYALAAIAFLVFLHFRSVGNVILALAPVAIGMTWLAGWMGWRGIPFNPANIMTLPLVIGIGVTNGIHILNRFAEDGQAGILAKSTGKAVLVSGLTTVAGFGSLITAKHQGIASLGLVMALGVVFCMIAALIFLPALLNLLNAGGRKTKKPSGDNAQSTLGREEPR